MPLRSPCPLTIATVLALLLGLASPVALAQIRIGVTVSTTGQAVSLGIP